MLTLTPDATQAIEQLLSDDNLPEGAGLRIEPADALPSSNGAEAEAGSLRIVIASRAPGGDQVVEHAGARVFIEPQISDFLDDKLLDIGTTEGQSTFMLCERP